MKDRLYTQFDGVFFEKTRISMMTMMYQEEAVSFNRFKKRLGGSDGAVYSHLEKLFKAGYVDKRKEIAGMNIQTVYFLTMKGKEEFSKYLSFLKTILQGDSHD